MLEFAQTYRDVTTAHRRFSLHLGTAIAELGDAWVAYSPATDTSHVLNSECACILRVLAERGAASSSEICTWLAADFDEEPSRIADIVAPMWDRLIELGLLDEYLCPTHPSPHPPKTHTPP